MCPSAFQPTSADSCLTESADPADFLMHQKNSTLMWEALESLKSVLFLYFNGVIFVTNTFMIHY